MVTTASTAIFLAAFGGLHAAESGWKGIAPSTSTVWRLERLEESLSMVPLGRRLKAEARDTPRMELRGLDRGAIIRFDAGRALLQVDPDRLSSSLEWDSELAHARELALAAFALPVDLAEARVAAYQLELDYALVRADQDPAFDSWLGKWWRELALAAPELPKGWRKGIPREEDPALCRAPPREGERAAYYLGLLAQDPDSFHWAVDCAWNGPAAPRWGAIQDFLAAHPPGSFPEPGPEALYVRLKGRRYPAALVRAALAVAHGGGLSRVREALGAYDTKPLPALRVRAARWIRRHSPKPAPPK